MLFSSNLARKQINIFPKRLCAVLLTSFIWHIIVVYLVPVRSHILIENGWPLMSDNKIKTEKLFVYIWPALCNPLERLASSRLTHAENIQKYKHPHACTLTYSARKSWWKTHSIWKGQGLWINSDRATGIWTQMAHNVQSPLNYAVWLFPSLFPPLFSGQNIHSDLVTPH